MAPADLPPTTDVAPESTQERLEASFQAIPATTPPEEKASAPDVDGKESELGGGVTEHSSLQRGGSVQPTEPTIVERGGLEPLDTKEVDPGGGILGTLVSSDPAPIAQVPIASPAAALVVPEGTPAAGAAESRLPGGGAPGTVQGNLPKLVSAKQKKGKKRGGSSRKKAPTATLEGAVVPKPPPRRRGPPPVERPGTHQMQRRSGRKDPPGAEGAKSAQVEGGRLGGEAVPTSAEAGGVAEIILTSVEAGLEVSESKIEPAPLPSVQDGEKSRVVCAEVDMVQGPMERLKGGAAPLVSGAEVDTFSGGCQSQGQGGERQRSSSERSAGRLLVRVEGSRLVLRRVKPSGGEDGQGIQGGVGSHVEESRKAASQLCNILEDPSQLHPPMLEVANLATCPECAKGKSLTLGAGVIEVCQEATLPHMSELSNELVLSEATMLTNCGRESEAPQESEQAFLRPVPDSTHGEEVLDTSSQDSLSLTYHGESKKGELCRVVGERC